MDKKWTSGNELKYLKEVLSNTDKVKANPFTDRLEKAFCEKYGVKYAIAVNSGTSGLHAALVAAGINPGDEVITTPFTVLVDSSIPILMGAEPVFADVDYGTHNIDPNSIEKVITKKTKAIIPVSYHGLPYDIDEVKRIADKYSLTVIEDNAQAMLAEYKGRYVGKDAHITMFSFERTKQVSCGEGGMLITNDENLAVKARKFAGMGFKQLTSEKSKMVAITPKDFQNPDYKRHDSLGLNLRFNEFCAAVALAQFERVEKLVALRKEIGKLYDKVFEDTEFEPQTIPEGYISSYFTYAVKSPFRSTKEWKRFYDHHLENGGDDFYSMMAIAYTEPIMEKLGYYEKFKGTCPVAEQIQPRNMLFKTNYRDIREASEHIQVLRQTMEDFKKGKI